MITDRDGETGASFEASIAVATEADRPSDVPGASGRTGPDRATRERLVRENLGWLRGRLRGRTRDAEAVDDICQDAFLKALARLHDLRDPARFPAWLRKIAENALRDHYRAEARRRARVRFVEEPEDLGVSAPEPEPEAQAGQEAKGPSEAERLLAAVRALPPRLRDPLLLLHTRRLPYREIAEVLGIRENTVQVRIFRARRLLRKRLGGEGGAGEKKTTGTTR